MEINVDKLVWLYSSSRLRPRTLDTPSRGTARAAGGMRGALLDGGPRVVAYADDVGIAKLRSVRWSAKPRDTCDREMMAVRSKCILLSSFIVR